MPSNLDSYRAKRNFSATTEPSGDPAESATERTSRFVVQEHHARSLHWDLRLEHDGALASWAVPKGIPPDPRKNHLAVQTEDHPLEYLDFHGEIPAGQYGAGTMRIWDRGTYETHKWRDKEVMVTFHGERVRGKYVLFRTDGNNWMIHRMDPPEDPDREPMPEHVKPMLARTGALPKDDHKWAYEIKWDGVRGIAYIDGGRLRLEARTGRDITSRYPELRELGRALAGRQAVLDGEVVAFDADGRPSFQKLQGRMHLTSEHAVRRLSQSDPVHYVVFDLLWLDGRDCTGLALEQRRELLRTILEEDDRLHITAHIVGEGTVMFEAAKAQQLEGIVAKRVGSPYVPGRRSDAWRKIKATKEQDCVILGYTPGQGGRGDTFGALLVGAFDDDTLRWIGQVGSGFTGARLEDILGQLEPLRTTTPAVEELTKVKGAVYVEPKLVCEVEYLEMTKSTRKMRAPVFKHMRPDKLAEDAVLERSS
jgi:bifunctional non-homologous end joining protein LigD